MLGRIKIIHPRKSTRLTRLWRRFFLLRFLSVKALFQLGQFGFECRIVFFELTDLDFQMFTQEKAPSSKAPGRTTITTHDKRLVCASDWRSGIAPAPLFRRATGLKLRTRQRNTEREIRGERSSKGQEVERKRDPLRRTDRASETA